MLIHIVEQHSEDEVLINIAHVFSYLSTNIAVSQQIETAKLRLIDTLAVSMRHGIQRFHEDEQLLEDDEAAILAAFRRFAAFYA